MPEADTTHHIFFPAGIFVIEFLCKLRAQIRSSAGKATELLELVTA